MLLLKTRLENIPGVLETSKHATHYPPKAEPGDLVLIAITRNTLPKRQKSIQYIARFRGLRPDHTGESIDIWKHPWRYIVELDDIEEVSPFNLEEVQASNTDYRYVRTHCRLRLEDEQVVLRWLGQARPERKAAEGPPQWRT